MPQFDFATVFIPQVAWLALIFAVLYFGVVRLTLPKLGRVMQAREDQVKTDLDTAQAVKERADKMAADYDAGVVQAQEAARGKLGESRAAAARALEAKLAASNAVIAEAAAAADASLAKARDKAMAEIETVAADAAADIVEKLTGTRPAGGRTAAAARAALG
jgi:F-type H+-transporting ATPase subunit b